MMFSIVIPVYNVENYIERCIKSVLAQTFRNFELLIIDDGSTDHSLNIIKRLQNEGKIRLFTQENRGTGAARNLGIKKANGDYCVFVDGDDYVEETLLDKLNDILKYKKYDAILFNSRCVNENGKYLSNFEMCGKLRGEISVCDHPEILILPTAPWNKVFNLSLIKENNVSFSEGISFEDTAFSRIMLSKAKEIYIDGGIYYNYVQRKTSAVNTCNIDKMMDIIPANQDLINAFKGEQRKRYAKEIEYIVASTVITYVLLSLNSINYNCSQQKKLCDFVLENFPDFSANKYLSISQKLMCKIVKRYKFLLFYVLFGFAYKIKRQIKSIFCYL